MTSPRASGAAAGSGNDYTVPKTVSVNAGATSANIPVNINNDRANEVNEQGLCKVPPPVHGELVEPRLRQRQHPSTGSG